MKVLPKICLGLIFLFGLPLGWGFDVVNEISYESGFRDFDAFDTNRLLYRVAVKQAWKRMSSEISGEMWAWKNFSSAQYDLTPSEIGVRTLKYFWSGKKMGIAAGWQQFQWSETFGLQNSDLLNARNFRDFSLMDHGRNRIAALNLNGFFRISKFRVQVFITPAGQIPILPTTLSGIAVNNDDSAGKWFRYPEFGIKAGMVFSDSNIQLLYYRHLNRIPAYLFGSTTPALTLNTYYLPVSSVAAGFSRGFEDFVLRADGAMSLDHPVHSVDYVSIARKVTGSATAGVDWSPVDLVSDFTIGGQLHCDKAPLPNATTTAGASLLLRKGFFDRRFEVEGKAFSGLTESDSWFEMGAKLRILDSWEWKLMGELIHSLPNSPFRLLGYEKRISTLVSYYF